jgi:hypothetical protein
MTMRSSLLIQACVVIALLMAIPHPVLATQAHSDPEGVVIHQFSHVFFIFSMGILIYWLRNRKLSMAPGWREIKIAAVFLILWSADAFVAHLLDEQLQWVVTSRINSWTRHVETTRGGAALAWFYYIAKLDHLLCVPGLFFLYRGLARLSADTAAKQETGGGSA